MKQALGMIETKGLVALFEATDAMLKSANVSFAGWQTVGSGLVTAFGQAPPDFTASALLDPTTINAEMVIDFGAGTPAPFTSYDTSQMVVDITNSSVGPRHEIQIGSQVISTSGMSSDPTITPNSSTLMFAIQHTVSGTVENFNEYSNFITQLQSELNGSVLVTGITAIGQYTAESFAFAANSITVTLYN